MCRYARRGELTYRLLTLTEMREEQPFAPDSALAAELALPNGCRRILTQPDMLVLDMRQSVDLPNDCYDPIAVLTPDNLFLATKLLPLTSLYLIEDLMESCGNGSDAYLSRVSPCLTWRARWQVALDKLAPCGNEPGAHEPCLASWYHSLGAASNRRWGFAAGCAHLTAGRACECGCTGVWC